MGEPRYTIAGEIFQRFPGYVRGVVVAHGVSNRPAPEELTRQLRAAEAAVRGQIQLEQLAEHPRIRSWREAYRSLGVKPAEFRSAIEALVRRVLRGEPLPPISALVDIGNLVSLRHLVPAGGHAIDVVRGDLALRPATGTEEFVPLGSDRPEHPLPGEVIFAEGSKVLTRRWTWRQGEHTLTRLETTAVEINVDGLPPVEAVEVEQAGKEIQELVERYCGGHTRFEMLSAAHPSIGLGPSG
ncbi:MAG TPA: phenylalanine--tRNA ligase beta subunit-related protein [Candidatus Saccharimonadales bacterium]|nr:phenylalanine--tRNA ligase beta subunit-related protein [Candidatus Saccharimonadales bacterium]